MDKFHTYILGLLLGILGGCQLGKMIYKPEAVQYNQYYSPPTCFNRKGVLSLCESPVDSRGLCVCP